MHIKLPYLYLSAKSIKILYNHQHFNKIQWTQAGTVLCVVDMAYQPWPHLSTLLNYFAAT